MVVVAGKCVQQNKFVMSVSRPCDHVINLLFILTASKCHVSTS